MYKYTLLFIIFLGVALALPLHATTYYVAPDGDDAADGLDSTTAWASLDNGDQKSLLFPGDTVNILPGTYLPTTTYNLKTSGTAAAPIVYRRWGKAPAILDMANQSNIILLLEGSNIVIQGLELTRGDDNAIHIKADSCTITECYIHDCSKHGIKLEASYNLLLRNIIYSVGEVGIKNEDAGDFNLIYGNTIHGSGTHGIELKNQAKNSRAFNNIVTQNDNAGIKAPPEAVCGFNNVWGNIGGDYDGGVVDSAGSISIQPRFVDPLAGRFDLRNTAAEINAGLDLGYRFNQTAPDMGAREKYNVYYVSTDGSDEYTGRSLDSAWTTIDNGDSLLFPGDTVYVADGTYSATLLINDRGLADDMIVYTGMGDSALIQVDNDYAAVQLNTDFVKFAEMSVSGASSSNVEINGNSNAVERCQFDQSKKYGVRVSNGYHNLIFRCIFKENDLASILLSSDSALVFNNTFYHSVNLAIDAQVSDYSTVTNCLFHAKPSGSTAIKAPETMEVTYSIFYDHVNETQGGAVLGTGCIIADPLMVNPDSGNFRLSSYSPAINTGTDIGFPFHGAAPDMGAIETGELFDLTVVPDYDSLLADSAYQFDVIAVDSAGYPASPGLVSWTHTFATGSISPSGLFTPELIGTGKITATSSVGGMFSDSPVLTVVPGSLLELTVSPQSDTLSADSTRHFAAIGLDIKDNEVTDLGSLTWDVLNNIGTIDDTGLFDAGRSGPGFIRASSDLGPVGMTDTILVVPGATAYLEVQPSVNIIVQSADYQYEALGYDADSNLTAVLTDSVTWSTTDIAGSITATGFYTAGDQPSPPLYYVAADYEGSLTDSGSVSVISSGVLDYIQIELADGTPLADTTLTTDNDTTRLYSRGYDSGDNLLGDLPVNWTLIGVDSIGTLTIESGNLTVLMLTRLGTGQVVATYDLTTTDTSGTITCLAGFTASLAISPDSAVISADSSLEFTVEVFDADGNPSVPGPIPIWSVLGEIGTISSNGVFTPTTAGVGSVVATVGSLVDTTAAITVTPGTVVSIGVLPDSVTVSADSTQQFEAVGYDAKGNSSDAGNITWTLTAPLGTIDSTGLFDAVTVGEGAVVAVSDLGLVDTCSLVEVVAGRLTLLTIAPDSVNLTTDDSLEYDAVGLDTDGNEAATGNIGWSVLGDIGEINSLGTFTPLTVGTGRIIATSSIDDITDTSTAVIVGSGALSHLIISPDTATMHLDSTLQFTVSGYDAKFNPTPTGSLNWSVLSGIGTVDTSGLFTADSPGNGRIAAGSGSVYDTTGIIIVEALSVTTIPLGNATVYPGQQQHPVLTFGINNPLQNDKSIDSLTLRYYPGGLGNLTDLLGNTDGLSLYLDIDNDSSFSASDSLLATGDFVSETVTMAFPSLLLPAGTDRILIVNISTSLGARDGDSLDVILIPGSDLYITDGTAVVGPDTANSLGHNVIDGLVSGQVDVTTTEITQITPQDSLYHLFTADIPANGYQIDTLEIFTIVNAGDATQSDLSSLRLYRDNGNAVWGSNTEEIDLGELTFTGSQWTRSGLKVPLLNPSSRFYVAARLSDYPRNGATLAISIPVNGLAMWSDNDGPIDYATVPVDTIEIQIFEELLFETAVIAPHVLVPGEVTDPLLGLELTNSYSNPVGVDSIDMTLVMIDPDGATPEQLDSQIDSLMLYINADRDFQTLEAADSLIAVAIPSGGVARFNAVNLTVPGSGGTAGLLVVARLSGANSKDGNSVSVELEDAAAVYTSAPFTVEGDFPLNNENEFNIDAFSAQSVIVHEVDGEALFGGQTDRLVFDFELPANGYASDYLQSIILANVADLEEPASLAAVKLWMETGNDGFSVDDSLLGEFTVEPSQWILTNLLLPIHPGGKRLFVTVDVAIGQFGVGTLRFQIPAGGAKYLSGMSGPDDASVGNADTHTIFPANRVTAISIPQPSRRVTPGSVEESILTFALYNGYIARDTTMLKALTLTNASHTVSSPDYADYEIGEVSLYYDADHSRTLVDDPLAGIGHLSDGILKLTGIDVMLPPESLSYFFVVVNIPTDVIDSDSLTMTIAQPSDFAFNADININGDLPLTSCGYLILDGSVATQYDIIPLPPRTLSPGDSAVTLFAFKPAINGDQGDILTSITLENAKDADTSEIARMQLWLDTNNDSTWQATDSLVGEFTYGDPDWQLDNISIAVSGPAPNLLVVADISSDATPNKSFQAVIPTDGFQYASDNDGPTDTALVAASAFTVSTSGLRVSQASLATNYSVGQTIAVNLSVTNLLDTTLGDVFGQILEISDSAIVVEDSSSAGPVNLASGDSTKFVIYFTALQPGSVHWRLQAIAPYIFDSSTVVQTEPVHIQAPPSNVMVDLMNSAPTSVTRGQTNVFPMSLSLTHSDSGAGAASIRLDSLALDIEDGSGAPVTGDAVFSRMVLTRGYTNLTILETVPGQSTIWLVFGQPVIIDPGKEHILSLLVDIDSAATAAQFVLSVQSGISVSPVDANTLLPISIDPGVTFPLRTASCRIDDPSQQIAIAYSSVLAPEVNFGQEGVSVLQLSLRHPGGVGSSQIQLSSLSMLFQGSLGDTLTPPYLVSNVRVMRQQTILGEVNDFPLDSMTLELPFNAPVTLSPGETDSVVVAVSIIEASIYSGFSLVVPDSTAFQVRDLSSGSLVQVVMDTTKLAVGTDFPIVSGWTTFRQPAVASEICVGSALPSSVVGGRDSLALMTISLSNPADEGYSPVRLEHAVVTVLDTLGKVLDPDRLFDRIGFRQSGGNMNYQSFIMVENGSALFRFTDTGLLIDPGQSTSLELMADIEADAPYDHFVLQVRADDVLRLRDATDTTHYPGFELAEGCTTELPLVTGATAIFLPAGRPTVSPAALGVAMAFPGQQNLMLLRSDLTYSSLTPQGDLNIGGMHGQILKRTDAGLVPLTTGRPFGTVEMTLDDQILAADSSQSNDSLVLTLPTGYTLSAGTATELQLRASVRTDAALGNYVIRFTDSTFLDISDKNLGTTLYPLLTDASYPLFSVEVSLGMADLGSSFTNYPNPFNPGLQPTTIAYALSADAHVDIEIFSITGKAVKEVVMDAFRATGTHQSDQWTGQNGVGLDVIPGTYFCRITARYTNGTVATFRRKIAVVR